MNFVNTASFQFINIVELNATPEKVFQVLCDGNSWCKWFPGIIFLSFLIINNSYFKRYHYFYLL